MKDMTAKVVRETTLKSVYVVPHWNMFTAAKNRLASHQSTMPHVLGRLGRIFNTSVQQRIAENSTTDSRTLDLLAQHESSDVRSEVAQNENTLRSTVQSLAGDVNSDVRYAMAANPGTSPRVLETLADDENVYVQDRAKRTQARLRIERTLSHAPASEQEKPVQSQRAAYHPFSLIFSNLFCNGPGTTRVLPANEAQLSLLDLAALPRNTQLLVAHFLQLNNPDLMLLSADTDVCKLVSTGWLISVPSSTIGIICFKFRPDCWRQLKLLCRTFLTADILSELKSFRYHKSALYPWVW